MPGSIPNCLYLCWFSTAHTEQQRAPSQEMLRLWSENASLNPDYENRITNLEQAHHFIKTYYSDDLARAFESVQPLAFKADLWRYAVLLRFGGIYIDAKIRMFKPFDDIFGTAQAPIFVSARDRPQACLYNAMLACSPGHPIIRRVLDLAIDNILNQRYGAHELSITGPAVLGQAFNEINGYPPDASAPLGLGPGHVPWTFDGNRVNDLENETVAYIPGYPEYYDRDLHLTESVNYRVAWHQRTVFK